MKNILPNGWVIKKSSDYCLRVADGTHDTPKPVSDGRKLITSKNIKRGSVNTEGAYSISQNDLDEINRRSKVDQWDVLFSMIGTVGEIALVKEPPDYAIKNIGLFKNKSKYDGVWLYYYLTSTIGQAALDTYLTGTSQQFVSLGDLRKVPVIEPTEISKKKIAAILSTYDDLIENNRRRIALLEKMAEEIYREWFVRMRFPGHGQAKFEKGVPVEWKQAELHEIADVNAHSIRRGSEPDWIEYIDISSVSTNQMEVPAKIKFTEAPGRARRLVEHGDVIWSSVRPGNKAYCLVLNPSDNLVASTGFAVISAKHDIPYTYVYRVVTTDSFVEEMVAVAKGAAYPATSFEDFEKAKILLPSMPLLRRFHEVSEPMHLEADRMRKQNGVLAALRDMLLPRLISGKLPVDTLDIHFPPSMQHEPSPQPSPKGRGSTAASIPPAAGRKTSRAR